MIPMMPHMSMHSQADSESDLCPCPARDLNVKAPRTLPFSGADKATFVDMMTCFWNQAKARSHASTATLPAPFPQNRTTSCANAGYKAN
jgi:hypothetical protein